MQKIGLHIALIVLFCIASQYKTVAQCQIDGPIIIPVVGVNSASITVSGLVNNDLGDPGQGLCGVRINFNHTRIGDVLLYLRSPSGQLIQLTGPESATSPTIAASWNVTFIRCSDAAAPDPGFSAQWNNDQPWALIGNYTGSYYPYAGCFETLTGSANGLWTIVAQDNQPFDGGEIDEIELFFCDDNGQFCEPCGAEAGELLTDTIEQCINELPANFDLQPTFLNGPPTPAYAYFYAITFNGIVTEVTSDFDNAGLATGIYTVCGLSVLHSDTNLIKTFPANIDLAAYEAFLLSSNICFDISTECAVLRVNPELPPTFEIDFICAGDTLFWRDSSFTTSGNYVVRSPGENGCLSNHNLSLSVIDPNPGIRVLDSFGCGIETATLIGIDSTFGNVVSFLWYTTDGMITSNTTGSQIDISSSGTYNLITTRMHQSGISCSDTASLMILNDFDEVQVSYLGDTISCSQDSVVATAFSNLPSAIYIWRNIQTGMEDTSRNHTIYWGDDYALIAVSPQGCRDELLVTLPYDTISPPVLLADIQKLCRDDSVIVSPVVVNPEWTYLWLRPNGDSVHFHEFSTHELGRFQLFVTAENGCITEAELEITHIGPVPLFQIVSDTFFCFTDSISVSVSTNLSELTYQITGPNMFESFDRMTYLHDLGTYTMTVETTTGCFYDTVWTAPELFNTDSIIVLGGNLDCAVDSVQLSADTMAIGLQYQWSGPGPFTSLEAAPFVNVPGAYTLDLRTRHGCLIPGSFQVMIDTIAPSVVIQVDNLGCTVDSVQMMVDAGMQMYGYDWEGPNVFLSQSQQPWVKDAGTYDLTVTGNNGCQVIYNIDVMIDTTAPTVSIVSSTITCFQPAADVTVTTNAASVLWTGPGFSSNDTTTTLPGAGNYSLMLVGANGCDTTINFTPQVDTLVPELQLFTDTIGCHRPLVPLYFESSDDIFNVTWNPATVSDPFADSTTTNTPGVYRVAVIGQNGCIGLDSIEVIADFTLPTVQIGGRDTINCLMDTSILHVDPIDPSIQYTWTLPSNQLIMADTIRTASAGVYLLSGEASNTCRDSAYITIVVDTMKPDIILMADSINCLNSMANVQVSLDSDEMVVWYWPDATTSIQPQFVTPLAGSFKAVVTNSRSGCLDSANIIVAIDTVSIENEILGEGQITCANQNVVLSSLISSDDAQLEWSGPSLNVVNQDSIEVSLPGVYYLRSTMTSGCFDVDSIEVDVDTLRPTITLMTDTLACDQPIVTIQFESDIPSITHEWKGPQDFMSSDSLPRVAIPGIYTVVVTAANGCEESDSVRIEIDTVSPTVYIEAELFSCDDTTALLRGVGSEDVVTYLWAGPASFAANTQEVLINIFGKYAVLAIAENGCVAFDSVSVEDFDLVDSVELMVDSINCYSLIASHLIEVEDADVSIEWFEGSTSVSLTNSLVSSFAGSIHVSVENTKGCTWDSIFAVVVDTITPVPLIVQDGIVLCGIRTVNLDATNLFNFSRLEHTWTTPNGTILSQTNIPEITVEGPGNYELFVLDTINGCSGSAAIEVVEQISRINIGDLIIQQPNCFNDYTATVEIADVTGETGTVFYAIDDQQRQFNPFFSPLAAGRHVFQVTDAFDCMDTISTVIDDVTVRFVDIERDTVLLLGQSVFVDPLTNFPSDQIDRIFWTINGQPFCEGCDSLSMMPTIGGNYAVYIIDTSGCVASDSILIQIVSVPALYVPTAFSPNDDGINDAFGPYFGNNVARVNEFSIFSRWGDRLHHRTNLPPEDDALFWDGRLKDQYLNPAVFIYTISIELTDGHTVFRKGEFQLVR